jgi:KaiC/GvpD/RAD55 family RecA-like ATPase
MTSDTNFEKIFLHYIRKNPEYFDYVKEDYFQDEEIKLTYSINKKFYYKYRNIPTKEQTIRYVTQLKKSKDKYKNLDQSHIEKIFEYDLNQLDPNWLKENAESWIEYNHFDEHFVNAIEIIKSREITPENLSQLKEDVKRELEKGYSIDLSFDYGKDFFNAEDHKPDEYSEILPTGFYFLDTAFNGGFAKGTLNLFLGLPNVGKSNWLCNITANYIKSGKNCVYVTLEMGEHTVMKRVGSNLFNVDIYNYDEWSKDTDKVKNKLHQLKTSNPLTPPGSLFVKQFPTSKTTPLNLESYLKKLEEVNNVNIDVLVLDYINLMRYAGNDKAQMYEKVKGISEEIRGIGVENNYCVVTATQLNRSSGEKVTIDMTNIAESFGVAATADTLIGIQQADEEADENESWLQIVKTRDSGSKQSKAMFKLQENHLRFTETNEVRWSSQTTPSLTSSSNNSNSKGENLGSDDDHADIEKSFGFS